VSAETHRPLAVRAVLRRLASLGSRYDTICRPMQPFVRHLCEACAGRKQSCSVAFSGEASCLTVRLFRALLSACSAISEGGFTRRLRFCTPKGRTVRATSDSSLLVVGIGVTWSAALSDGGRQDIGYTTAVCIATFGFDGMPECQNVAEFMGTIIV